MALLKCFICSGVGILDSLWCNNSCRAYQELGQGADAATYGVLYKKKDFLKNFAKLTGKHLCQSLFFRTPF